MKMIIVVACLLSGLAGAASYYRLESIHSRTTSHGASAFPKPSDQELKDRAEHIVLVQVGKRLESITHESGNVYGQWKVSVVQDFKGNAPQELVVTQLDSTPVKAGIRAGVSSPLKPGHEYLLFLYKSPSGWWLPIGEALGRFDLESTGKFKHAESGETLTGEQLTERFSLR